MRLLVGANALTMLIIARQAAHDAFLVREMFHHEAQQLRQPIHENVKTAIPLPLSTTVATTAQGAATQGLHGLQQRHKLVVFRVMQEALTNISKYAQATHVRVMLHDKKDYALLQVLDDGVGFNVNQKAHASYGLSGMRHRLEAMHGSLRIVSAPGRGTRIEGSLPQARHRMAEPVRQEPPAAAGMEKGSPAMLQADPAPATLG